MPCAVQASRELGNAAWLGAANFVYALSLPMEAAAAARRVSENSLTELQYAARDSGVRHMSLGRALANSGQRDKEALVQLALAERAAPAPFRLNSITSDLVATMITRQRRKAVAEELITMAKRLGINPI